MRVFTTVFGLVILILSIIMLWNFVDQPDKATTNNSVSLPWGVSPDKGYFKAVDSEGYNYLAFIPMDPQRYPDLKILFYPLSNPAGNNQFYSYRMEEMTYYNGKITILWQKGNDRLAIGVILMVLSLLLLAIGLFAAKIPKAKNSA